MAVLPCHISTSGSFVTSDGKTLQWSLSPRVYQGRTEWKGDVSLSLYNADFHASRNSIDVMLPPEVVIAIAEGMPKALSDLAEMLEFARREGRHP